MSWRLRSHRFEFVLGLFSIITKSMRAFERTNNIVNPMRTASLSPRECIQGNLSPKRLLDHFTRPYSTKTRKAHLLRTAASLKQQQPLKRKRLTQARNMGQCMSHPHHHHHDEHVAPYQARSTSGKIHEQEPQEVCNEKMKWDGERDTATG